MEEISMITELPYDGANELPDVFIYLTYDAGLLSKNKHVSFYRIPVSQLMKPILTESETEKKEKVF